MNVIHENRLLRASANSTMIIIITRMIIIITRIRPIMIHNMCEMLIESNILVYSRGVSLVIGRLRVGFPSWSLYYFLQKRI